MHIVLAGGTGFIGKALLGELKRRSHRITLLTRNQRLGSAHTDALVMPELWDGKTLGPWADRIEGVDAVINLSGESIVGKRWSEDQKKVIKESRTCAAKTLVEAMAKAAKKPHVYINASAVGYYGHVPQGDVFETYPSGADFLAGVCKEWENEAQKAAVLGVRVVRLRIGVVLDRGGGALQKMEPPFKLFIGGPLGSGDQWFPWIHLGDVIGIILFALNHSEVDGPINVTAPQPVTMKDFCATLGKVMGRPSWAPVPAFALKILLGEMANVLLTGQRAVPAKLKDAGYPFKYQRLEEALKAIYTQHGHKW